MIAAGQPLRRQEDGVTAVIATVMLIGIAILFAITILLVGHYLANRSSTPAPAMAFRDDDANQRWTLSQAATGVSWNSLQIRSTNLPSGVTMQVGLNCGTGGGAPSTSSCAPPAKTPVSATYSRFASTANTAGGDFLQFCASGGSGPYAGITIALQHINSNAIVHSYTFPAINVASC